MSICAVFVGYFVFLGLLCLFARASAPMGKRW